MSYFPGTIRGGKPLGKYGNAGGHDQTITVAHDRSIYVHSKLMIADTKGGYQDIDGSGMISPYRTFARDLRKNALKKLLSDVVGEFSDFLNMPAKAEGWQKIRALAMNNAGIYENVFDFIPKDYLNKVDINKQYQVHEGEDSSSLWPVFKSKKFTPIEAAKEMPFSDAFWVRYYNRFGDSNDLKNRIQQLKNKRIYTRDH